MPSADEGVERSIGGFMKSQFRLAVLVVVVLVAASPTATLAQLGAAQQQPAQSVGQFQEPSQQRIGPGRDPQVSEVFSFKPYEFATHPLYETITAFWQHNPGTVLDISLPFGSGVRFDLRRLPTDTWVDLEDASGKPIPLSIFVHSRGPLFGKWLE
jgi:hypothetical protein